MMKPSVGLTVLTSSPMTRFTIVVLPALSRPLGGGTLSSARAGRAFARWGKTHSIRMRNSLSLSLAFLKIDNMASAA